MFKKIYLVYFNFFIDLFDIIFTCITACVFFIK